jgi:hypothetical protein
MGTRPISFVWKTPGDNYAAGNTPNRCNGVGVVSNRPIFLRHAEPSRKRFFDRGTDYE